MWRPPRLSHEFVTIGCTPHALILAWIKKIKNHSTLMAYRTIACDHLQLFNTQLFNPTIIAQHITQFLARHKLQDAFVSMWLTGPAITQQLITCSNAQPTLQDLGITQTMNLVWDYQYLYPTDDGRFVFYVTSIPKELIFQYQLMVTTARINLVTITAYQIALLHLYHFIQGKAFRHSKLAFDVQQKNNRIDLLFTPDIVNRTLAIAPAVQLDFDTEFPSLLGIIGLFVMETIHEKN